MRADERVAPSVLMDGRTPSSAHAAQAALTRGWADEGVRPSKPWLSSLLARNERTDYLRRYGSPRTIEAFRERVPVTAYDDLVPWIDRIRDGESDVLFTGRPI